jgi:ABC-type glycerol-3-phosphate transport system permease component
MITGVKGTGAGRSSRAPAWRCPNRRSFANFLSYVALGGLSLLFLSPFLWSLLTSLKSNSEIYSAAITILPRAFSLEHYRYVATGIPDFLTYFKNSVIVSLVSVFLVALFSSLAGYALGRFEFRGSRAALFFVLLVLALPWGIFLIPIYIMEDLVGLVDTNTGLILPYVALNLPLATMIMRGTFRTIPSALEDAARIDGCNSFQAWYLVMMPLARGGLAASTIFTFITVWGEFMFARTLMLTTQTKTLAVGITDLRVEGGAWAYGILSATILLSIIPTLVLFIYLEKHFTRAILEGSLKG